MTASPGGTAVSSRLIGLFEGLGRILALAITTIGHGVLWPLERLATRVWAWVGDSKVGAWLAAHIGVPSPPGDASADQVATASLTEPVPGPVSEPSPELLPGPASEPSPTSSTEPLPAPLAGSAAEVVASAGTLAPRHWLTVLTVGAAWVLTVVAAALAVVMTRIDSALQQMGVGAGSTLGFPLKFGRVPAAPPLDGAPGFPAQSETQRSVDSTISAWTQFVRDTAPANGKATSGSKLGCYQESSLRCPTDIVDSLLRLDAWFMLAYGLLFIVAILALLHLNAAGGAGTPTLRRHLALRRAIGGLIALLVVDLVEDLLLRKAFVDQELIFPAVAGGNLGAIASALKFALSLAIVVTILLVALALAVQSRALKRALISARGVLYGIGALSLLLLVGIGADQIDDVIRGWGVPRGILSGCVAAGLLGLSVAGVIRRLTNEALDRPLPGRGRSPQNLLLGVGAIVAVVGAGLLPRLGQGWGIGVAGLLLVAIWAAGIPFEGSPSWPAEPNVGRLVKLGVAVGGCLIGYAVARLTQWPAPPALVAGAVTALAGLAWWALAQDQAAPAPTQLEASEAELREHVLDVGSAVDIAVWGDRVGRLAGSVVPALVVVVAARAVALDAWVDRTPSGSILNGPTWAIALALVVGTALCVVRAKVVGVRGPWWRAWWVGSTVVAAVAMWWLAQDDVSVSWAQTLGTLVVVFLGFAVAIGGLTAAASVVRQGPARDFQLAPALRAFRLRRFPVVAFLVAWVVVVAQLDQGGFHDIRRGGTDALPVPTIGEALTSYLGAGPAAVPGAARPVVLVGASGGGIRAAVWTSLVMECLFGPGPVKGANAGVCAHDSGTAASSVSTLGEEAAKPLPVFLASGASGGSVGLAAWSARRTDLVDSPTADNFPNDINTMLAGDLVAPLVGRMFVGDLPNVLLAGRGLDRATLLEYAWEHAYAGATRNGVDAGRGMARGLRATWDVSHRSGTWSTPVLALNGTQVEDGCRFLAGPVDFRLPGGLSGPLTNDHPDDAGCRGPRDPRQFARSDLDAVPSTSELVDYLCPNEDVPLSTAAHLSARFPFASPTGRIERKACDPGNQGLVRGPAVSYAADGGIFDNSGAGTAVDVWRSLAPFAKAQQGDRCLVPIFVQIDNSPPAVTVADLTSPDKRPYELLAPASMMLGQITSREEYARAGAAVAFTSPTSLDGRRVTVGGKEPDSLWFRITLSGQPGPEPPLGWTLAPATVEDMRAQLNGLSNSQQIRQIRDQISGRLACQAAAR